MQKPLTASWQVVLRCAVAWLSAWQEMPKAVIYETASDWAEDEITQHQEVLQ